MSEPQAYQFDGHTWKVMDDGSPMPHFFPNRKHPDLLAEDPSSYGDAIKRYQFKEDSPIHFTVKDPFDENLTLPSGRAFTIDEDGIQWIISTDLLYRKTGDHFEEMMKLEEKNSNDHYDNNNGINFTKTVAYFKENEYAVQARDLLFLPYDQEEPPFYDLDSQNNIWGYQYEWGVFKIDKGYLFQMGKLPVYLAETETGGVYAWNDSHAWVGSRGVIWEIQNGNWRQLIIPGSSEVVNLFAEDSKGILYAATDTGVFRFESDKFAYINFVNQNEKPYVYSNNEVSGPDSWYKNYTLHPNSGINNENTYKNQYKTVYFEFQKDGSLIYANNHVLAKLVNRQWKSFYFDTFNITSVGIGAEGKIWLFSDQDGLISLDADVFEAYH